MRTILLAIVATLGTILIAVPAFAAGNDIWVGNSSANWSDSNWSGANNPPITGDSLEFGTAGSFGTNLTDDISTSPTFTGITFDAGAPAYTMTGSDLLLLSGPINNNSSNDQTLGLNLSGIVTNSGTGSGSVIIDGGLSTNVSTITEDSSTSALLIDTNPITVNGGGTTLTDTAGTLTVSSGVTGTGDLLLLNNSNTDNALSFTTDSLNNSGIITNLGIGSGETLISGGVGSSVTGITENSATSELVISTDPIEVNSGGTTITDTAGILAVAGGVTGMGNVILQNNSGTADAIFFDTDSINNTGTITNSGTSGETFIGGGVGSSVTGITENSATSALAISANPIAVNAGGTTLTDTAGVLTVSGGVSGIGGLILQNNSGTDDALSFNTTSINNIGTITNSGSSGETEISGGVGSSVTGITENSASSALAIDTNAITANTSGTTLTDTLGRLTVSGGVTGTGNLVLNNNVAVGNSITLSTTSVDNSGSITNSGTGGSTLISAQIGSLVSNVIQDSINSYLILSNASNAYSGPTRIMAGTLQTAATGAIPDTSDVSVSSGATLDLDGNSQDIGSLRGAGTVTNIGGGGSVTLTTGTDDGTSTFSGAINNGFNPVALTEDGTGVLTLSGNNSYSGGTAINAGSSITVANTNALGTGAVTNNGTLNLGTTNLTLGGVYTQGSGSVLNLTVSSPSTFGSITSTGNAAVVNAASTIKVNVTGSIPNGTTFDIINTGGTGVSADPTTVDSNSARTSFIDSIVGDNLILTADTLASYESLGNNPNAVAIGKVLDNITNGSSDMTNVLNTLSGLSNAQITASLNTLGPEIDGGIIQDSSASLSNLISATLDRIQSSLSLSGNPASSGVSSGDDSTPNGIWAKPYGSYLTQGKLQGVEGYDAWNAGTVIGYDRMVTDDFTLGISGGYAYGEVDSDANSANVDINSAQATIYGGYQDPDLNFFIDGAGSFAENWYDGKRDITVGSFSRTADSSYDGQQYATYLDGGYKFNLGGNVSFTPLTSIQWTHLDLPSYSETNASSLDLNVDKQQYNTLESGLGASIADPIQFDWGNFIPELHAKWLYDYIGDKMVVTSSFSGGGGSFTSYGANPSKDGVDIGGKLSFNMNNDFSFIASVDTELKDGFFGVYGSGTVRYKF